MSARSTLKALALLAAALSTPAFAGDNQWTFHVSPYLWALNMNGTVQAGNTRAHVNETFSDIWDQLDVAGMLWLDAEYNKFGFFLNGLYAVLSKTVHDGAAAVNAKNRFGLYSGGISYRVYDATFGPSSDLSITPYGGFRYTTNDVRLNLDAPTINFTVVNNQYWTDPIIGARIIYRFADAWKINFSADIGGTNASSQHSYNVIGLIGYETQTHLKGTTVYAGYRILDQLYKDGSGDKAFVWNMKLFGPVIGIAIPL